MIVDAMEKYQGYVHPNLENFELATNLNIYKKLVEKILEPRFKRSKTIKKIIDPHGCEMYRAPLYRPYVSRYIDFIGVIEKSDGWYYKYRQYEAGEINGAFVDSREEIYFGSKLQWLKFHIDLEEDQNNGLFPNYHDEIDVDVIKRYKNDTKYAAFDTSFDTLSYQKENRQYAINKVIENATRGKLGIIISIIKEDEFRRLKISSRVKRRSIDHATK